MSLTPLACDLMGWRGAGGGGAAQTGMARRSLLLLGSNDTETPLGAYFSFGAILMTIGGLLEWVLGNTFPAVVFVAFGAFWFTYGAVLVPSFNSTGAYDPSNPANGASTEGFASSFAFFLLWMGFLAVIFLVASLRTNLVFVIIFFGLIMTFVLLAAEYWYLAMGDAARGASFQTAAGAFAFFTVRNAPCFLCSTV